MWPKSLIILATVAGVLAVVAIGLFVYGTPTTLQVSPLAVSAGSAPPLATAPDASSPLAIEVPGCVCHSDDPQLVAEHATYRMSQCFDCHSDGTPAMGQ